MSQGPARQGFIVAVVPRVNLAQTRAAGSADWRGPSDVTCFDQIAPPAGEDPSQGAACSHQCTCVDSMSRSAVTTRVTAAIMTTATTVAVPGFLPQPPRRPLERLDDPTVVHGPATGGRTAAGLRRRLRRRPPSNVTTATTTDLSERESAAAARPRRGRLASRGR